MKSSKLHCAFYTHSTCLCLDKPHFKSSKAMCASGCRPRGFNSRLCWRLPLPLTAGFGVGNGPGRAPCWGSWDKHCLWAPSAWGLGGMVFKPAWASRWAALALPTGTPRPTAQPRRGPDTLPPCGYPEGALHSLPAAAVQAGPQRTLK